MRYYLGCTTNAKWMQEFKESVLQWFADQERARGASFSGGYSHDAPSVTRPDRAHSENKGE